MEGERSVIGNQEVTEGKYNALSGNTERKTERLLGTIRNCSITSTLEFVGEL